MDVMVFQDGALPSARRNNPTAGNCPTDFRFECICRPISLQQALAFDQPEFSGDLTRVHKPEEPFSAAAV
jgi:hypothetical protein